MLTFTHDFYNVKVSLCFNEIFCFKLKMTVFCRKITHGFCTIDDSIQLFDQKLNKYHSLSIVFARMNLVLCGFFPFLKLKLSHREKRFESTEVVKENLLKELKAISSAYEKYFEESVKRWHVCVAKKWGLLRGGQNKFIKY